jgi:nucleosome assembly protein 1-like 1
LEQIIPRAIDYFTGKALQYELDDEDYSEEEGDEEVCPFASFFVLG